MLVMSVGEPRLYLWVAMNKLLHFGFYGYHKLGDAVCSLSSLLYKLKEEAYKDSLILAPEVTSLLKELIEFLPIKDKPVIYTIKDKKIVDFIKNTDLVVFEQISHWCGIDVEYFKADKRKLPETIVNKNGEEVTLEEPFYTFQVDSWKYIPLKKARERVKDLNIVEIGDNKHSIANTLAIMNKAEGHIGADSGMVHLAMTVMKPEAVHCLVPEGHPYTHPVGILITKGAKVEKV